MPRLLKPLVLRLGSCPLTLDVNSSAMVDTTSFLVIHGNEQLANTEYGRSGATNGLDRANGLSNDRGLGAHKPTLSHKVKNQKSILALVVSDSKIYAGTQDGELKVLYLYPCKAGTANRST